MCNLYRLEASAGEVASLFRAIDGTAGSNRGNEVYPGYPGLVVAKGELRQMTWGFPLAQRSKATGQSLKPKPVNNTRTDKLDSFFWRMSFAERRCLIPLTAWAEAEGPRGAKTRTWLSLTDQPIFACAAIWRKSEEWGHVYSMVMTNAAGDAAKLHNRMPVILRRDDWSTWQDAAPEEARRLCVGYKGALEIDRTSDAWVGS